MKQKNWLKVLSCSVFAALYLIVAIISLICSTEFFKLAHSGIMSWVLAIGFEIGAMSCLLSTLILPKKKLGLVWFMFIVLTLFQCMGNMYAAFINLENFQDWIDMFGMTDMELIAQKRVLAGISGVILPLVALGFIRIMADVLQDGHMIEINDEEEIIENPLLVKTEEPSEEFVRETQDNVLDNGKPEETQVKDISEKGISGSRNYESPGIAGISEEPKTKDISEKGISGSRNYESPGIAGISEETKKEPVQQKEQKRQEQKNEHLESKTSKRNMNPELG